MPLFQAAILPSNPVGGGPAVIFGEGLPLFGGGCGVFTPRPSIETAKIPAPRPGFAGFPPPPPPPASDLSPDARTLFGGRRPTWQSSHDDRRALRNPAAVFVISAHIVPQTYDKFNTFIQEYEK